jgi:flotillin
MVLDMLPDLVKEASQPLGNIEKITVVDTGQGGKDSGANKITNYATNLLASSQETLKETTGLDVKDLLESFASKGSKNVVNFTEHQDN